MAKCPACGANLNDWRILTLGAKNHISCSQCKALLKPQAEVSSVKLLLGTGFMIGGVGSGLIVAFGVFAQWIAFVLIWFLFLALADIRFTQLEVNGRPGAKPGPGAG